MKQNISHLYILATKILNYNNILDKQELSEDSGFAKLSEKSQETLANVERILNSEIESLSEIQIKKLEDIVKERVIVEVEMLSKSLNVELEWEDM